MQIPEEQLLAAIDRETGLSFKNEDYGFIVGTQHPFYGTYHKVISASAKPGFIVWVNKSGKRVEQEFYTYDQKKTIKEIIGFLKENSRSLRIRFSKKTG